jgi:hypothetical protein
MWKKLRITPAAVVALWKLVKVVKQSCQPKKSCNLGIIKADKRLRSLQQRVKIVTFWKPKTLIARLENSEDLGHWPDKRHFD